MNFIAAATETYFPNISETSRNAAQADPPVGTYAPAELDPNAQPGNMPEDGAYQDSGTIDGTQAQEENQAAQASDTAPDGSPLTADELRLVEELQTVDKEVRQHEMAHVAAGGSLVTSAAQFTYKTGPDGQQYAVAGEVGIDTSPVPGDPQATIDKMEKIKQAALAPASPSPQDLKVAAQAKAVILEAIGELTTLTAKQQAAESGSQPQGSAAQTADSYSRVSTLPESDTYTFELAV